MHRTKRLQAARITEITGRGRVAEAVFYFPSSRAVRGPQDAIEERPPAPPRRYQAPSLGTLGDVFGAALAGLIDCQGAAVEQGA